MSEVGGMERSRALCDACEQPIHGAGYSDADHEATVCANCAVALIGQERDIAQRQLRGAADTLRERVMALGGMRRAAHGSFWIDRDDVLRLLDEIGGR